MSDFSKWYLKKRFRGVQAEIHFQTFPKNVGFFSDYICGRLKASTKTILLIIYHSYNSCRYSETCIGWEEGQGGEVG